MHTKWIFVICSLVFLNGCTESYDDYYKTHIIEAKLKSESCAFSLNQAKAVNNQAEIKVISEDAECLAAQAAFKQHAKNIPISPQVQDKQSKKIKQDKFNIAYKKQQSLLIHLPYLEYLAVKKECKNKDALSVQQRARCKAYYDIFDTKKANEILALQDKYKGESLEAFRDKSCTGKNFDQVYCGLSMIAAKNQIKQLQNSYSSNITKLKKDFNKCQKAYAQLLAQVDRRQANKVLMSYSCKVVGDSARKLKVYNFDKAIL